MIIFWLCSKLFKPFREFRIELNKKLEKIEAYLLYRYVKYEIIRKANNANMEGVNE